VPALAIPALPKGSFHRPQSPPLAPFGPHLGFVPLPLAFWPILAGILLAYVALTRAVKTWLLRKGWVAV